MLPKICRSERKGRFNMKVFFASLSKSAKVTLITCGSFLILTMLLMIFLMLCPIHTESSANNINEGLIVTTSATETTATETTTIITRFTRRTTTVGRRTTTERRTTTAAYISPNVMEEDETYGYDGYDDYDGIVEDTPVLQTTQRYTYTSPSYQTTIAPTWTYPQTQAPVVVETEPPTVVDPPVQETLPAQEADDWNTSVE